MRPAHVRSPIGRLSPHAARGFHLNQPEDWPALVETRMNLLVVGPDSAADAFIVAATPLLHQPVQSIVCENGLTLGPPPATLILRHIDALTPEAQRWLYRWLDHTASRYTQIVSHTAAPLFAFVEAGSFDDRLYYRLNILRIEVVAD